jgi:hypothetical protein
MIGFRVPENEFVGAHRWPLCLVVANNRVGLGVPGVLAHWVASCAEMGGGGMGLTLDWQLTECTFDHVLGCGGHVSHMACGPKRPIGQLGMTCAACLTNVRLSVAI